MTDRPIHATVSGSFRRAMSAVSDAVYGLTDAGAIVLSPADPRVVDQFGDFLFVASDRVRVIRLVQDRHLAAIRASDFVWLVAPEGYVGQSGAMEIGFANAIATPIFSSDVPIDLTLRQYVTTLASPQMALRSIRRSSGSRESTPNVLLDPNGVLQTAHDDLERIASELAGPGHSLSREADFAASRLSARVTGPLSSR